MPNLSVVVVVYNLPREAPRTLLSLSAAYQRHIDPDDYEVIVVDNGSTPPVDRAIFDNLRGHFRLLRIDPAPPSPAHAVNQGIAAARGDVIGVMIDGARMATPGLLHFARHGTRLHEAAVVATLGWYLGGDFQGAAIEAGYSQAREDALLDSIDWPRDGYRLFEIGTMDESSVHGWTMPNAESNGLFLRREMWEALGRMDERFDLPGGGLVNLDTYRRALELPGAELVLLLGEGSFHQIHDGTNTNATPARQLENWQIWDRQYQSIRGCSYAFPIRSQPPTFLGTLPDAALSWFVRSATVSRAPEPLGVGFAASSPRPDRPAAITALVALAHAEFRAGQLGAAGAVARVARRHAPDDWELQRLLSLTASSIGNTPNTRQHLAIGEAHRLLGEHVLAESSYRAALAMEGDLVDAHLGLSTMRLPGDNYYAWLSRLYSSLAPRTLMEIGVGGGDSLALVEPPTIAMAVDPAPILRLPLKTEAHLFAETSDEFFARRRPDSLLAGRPLDIAFIDGAHLFEQSLTDFINLERYCGPHSIILLHDTMPLDEATQTRVRHTQFHTGDVWKTVLCLRHYRPDLDVFTIATPWSGLTVVTGLDPTTRVLPNAYEQAVARFLDMPFSALQDRADVLLNVVPNDWDIVGQRLAARGIVPRLEAERR